MSYLSIILYQRCLGFVPRLNARIHIRSAATASPALLLRSIVTFLALPRLRPSPQRAYTYPLCCYRLSGAIASLYRYILSAASASSLASMHVTNGAAPGHEQRYHSGPRTMVPLRRILHASEPIVTPWPLRLRRYCCARSLQLSIISDTCLSGS